MTFQNDGLAGFGDFSIIGDNYNDGRGGQANVAAIHLLYERLNNGGEVWLKHFLSEIRDFPLPQGEIITEALVPLVDFLETHPEIPEYSTACQELLEMHEQGATTSLGIIKKITMKHHLELMMHLLSR